MNRRRLIRKGRAACYHCVARVVGAQFLLDELGKETVVKMMWRQAAFSGIEVVTYCMMSNHFHVLIRVPAEQPQLTDAALVERVQALYGKQSEEARFLNGAMAQGGSIYEGVRQRLIARMGNVSVFMKELKQRFSRWYNRRYERFGTLWAERFRSVLVEDGGLAMEAVAAYIDLNPVRAGLVEDPKEYRFCGYAAALAGNSLARSGLMSFGEHRTWKERAAWYRMRLFVGAGTAHQLGKHALCRERIEAEVERGGILSMAELIRLRVRFFLDGVALGSRAFVEDVFREFRDRFGPKRRRGAHPIRALAGGGLAALRDLRVRALE